MKQAYLFSTTWCSACHALKPTMEEVAQENPDILFTYVDCDASPDLVKRFKIRSVPTFVVTEDEITRATIIHPVTKNQLLQALKE